MRLCTQAYKSHRSQCCGVKQIDTDCKTVAVMVSYDSILHVWELCGHEVCREFLVTPIAVHMNCQFLRPPPLVWKFLNEATIDSVLLERFKDQTTTRLLIAVLEEMKTLGTTQKEDVKKTPAKMLPSTLNKHCMCTICILL